MEEQLPFRNYQKLVFDIRGQKVMLDADLAMLYGIPTKALKQQVKRNINRFPPDFMFELNPAEFRNLRSQTVTSNRGGSRYLPMAFTEHGVAMLSSVINSDKAVQINIEIMRAFSKYMTLVKDSEDIKDDIRQLDDKINQAFQFLLSKIEALQQEKIPERVWEPVGFKIPAKQNKPPKFRA